MVGRLAGGSDDLLMALMTNEQDVVVVAGKALGLVVHLGDQRAGGVDDSQRPLGRRRVHGWRDAVRGKHHDGALGDLVGLVDENCPRLGQGVDHVAVVHDLVPDVDRRAVFFQRTLDRLDRAVDAGAIPARLGQQHPLAGHRPTAELAAPGIPMLTVGGMQPGYFLRTRARQLALSAWS